MIDTCLAMQILLSKLAAMVAPGGAQKTRGKEVRSRLFLASALGLSLSMPAGAEGLNPTKTEINAWVGADVNEDGVLTENEFPRFIDAMAAAGQSTAATVRFFGAYGIAFSVADDNGDGRVTPEELRSADDTYREEEQH